MELLTVIAIMAILASVAVPLTVNYISKTNETVDTAYAEDVAANVITIIASLNDKQEEITAANIVANIDPTYAGNIPYPIVATTMGPDAATATAIASENPGLDGQGAFIAVYVNDTEGILVVYMFKNGNETNRAEKLYA